MSLPRMSDMEEIGGVSGADSLSEAAAEDIFKSLGDFQRDQYKNKMNIDRLAMELTSSANVPARCPLGSEMTHAAMTFLSYGDFKYDNQICGWMSYTKKHPIEIMKSMQ